MTTTAIEWTDAVWNPVTGCTKVSEGCRHCYAQTFANRQMGPWKGRAFTDVRCHPERLDAPLRWRKPRRVFVNSMSDLFHPDVPDDFIDRVFAVMALCPQHTFQVLTKRPERMREYLVWSSTTLHIFREGQVKAVAWEMLGHPPLHRYNHIDANGRNVIGRPWPLPNVWFGVSVEDQATADARIPLLLQTPASLRFVSCEPLLGSVDLDRLYSEHRFEGGGMEQRWDSAIRGRNFSPWADGDVPCERLDWVIVGGESGPKARPCYTAWIRSIVQQCQFAAVPCFVKQVGSRPIIVVPEPRWPGLLRDKKGGDPSEWPEDLRVREMPR